MSLLQERQQAFIANLADLTEWNDKFTYLIDLAQAMPEYPAHLRVPELLLEGCQSKTYFACSCDDEGIQIYAASNALIPLGLAAACLDIFTGVPREELIPADINFHIVSGLLSHLSPSRAGGLEQMIHRILSC